LRNLGLPSLKKTEPVTLLIFFLFHGPPLKLIDMDLLRIWDWLTGGTPGQWQHAVTEEEEVQ
jgi:hypothetical protein